MLKFLSFLPKIKPARGRQIFSYIAAKFFEKTGINRLFGANLVAAMIITGVITPQVNATYSLLQAERALVRIEISANVSTKSTFAMPVTDFRLSQTFTNWHTGIDLVAPQGTPVHAVESGRVESTENGFFGYGKNVRINHNNDFKSLYAHLSQIHTEPGQLVERGQIIGLVGHTGWATGDHLHLEIYYKNSLINPLDVLPVKREQIKYDNLYFQLQASPSAITSSSTTITTPAPVPSSL